VTAAAGGAGPAATTGAGLTGERRRSRKMRVDHHV